MMTRSWAQSSGAPATESNQVPVQASAQESSRKDPYEWKIFPVLGGNSDIGFQFGAIGIITRLGPPQVPYHWSLRIQGSLSVKKGPLVGVEFPVHEDFVSFDYRHPTGRWRLSAEVKFSQAANAGYYGLGNASPPPIVDPVIGTRYTQYLRSDLSATLRGAWTFSPAWNLLYGLGVRRLGPEVYAGSILAGDLPKEPLIGGLFTHVDPVLLLGLERDARDNEINPSRGHWLTLAVRGVPGPVAHPDLGFVATTLNLRLYLPLWKKAVVLALRQVSELVLGNPPLHDLSRSSGFDTVWMLGGTDGVRGVPEGRYQGRIRMIGNAELRVMPARFTLFKQRFETGFAAFLDGGRVWADWAPRPELDGNDFRLHWGAGAGWRLRWGESVLIRLDFAYAPDAAAVDPGFPVGLYIDLGHVF
jgi:hypothetical protein